MNQGLSQQLLFLPDFYRSILCEAPIKGRPYVSFRNTVRVPYAYGKNAKYVLWN